MEAQIFQTNPRLRGLLLILIFTFAGCGIALAVLAQIQAYHREQIYLATESALPVHRTSQSVNQPVSESALEGWKTYRNEKYKFEFRYPSEWELLVDGSGILTNDNPFQVNVHGSTKWVTNFLVRILRSNDETGAGKYFPAKELIVSMGPVTVAQQSAQRIIYKHLDWLESAIYIEKDGWVFEISFEQENSKLDPNFTKNKKIYDEILSTFKFIK